MSEKVTQLITLENNSYNVKYVVHTADIHIRMFEREEEYLSVFNRFYEDLKKRKLNNKNSVIVICGDIMHNKEILHPKSLEICTDFFYNLASITNLIIISGNHDKCDNNPDIDVIKAILNIKFNTLNKIYFIDESKCYLYNNIIFGLTRVFDKNVTKCNFTKLNKFNKLNKIRIGLYHGQVISPLNENQMFFVKDTSINYTEFADYDIVLLGDIHQQQYLNEEKTIAYCGSLIQQNKSESIKKGYLLWNIHSKTSEFIQIRNDYMTLKITIGSDGKWKKPLLKGDMPKYAKIDIISNSENQTDIVSVYDWCTDKGVTVLEKSEKFEVNRNKINNIIKFNNTDTTLNLLSNKEKICELILNGIKEEFKNESIKNKIKDLVKNAEIKDLSVKNIKLLNLKFDNFMKYGENNTINFNNLKSINGLCSPNSSGKSTIIDVILFSIYGECTRGSAIDLINNKSKRLFTEIELDVNNIKYKIQRKATRNDKKEHSRKVGTELIIFENDINISSDVKKNNKIISEKICSFDDFIHNCIISQNTKVNFMNFTPKEKNDYLYKIFNIEVLKDIDKSCSNYVRNLKTEITRKKKNLVNYEMYGTNEKEIIKNINEKLQDKIKEKENLIKQIDKLSDEQTLIKINIKKTNTKDKEDIEKIDIKKIKQIKKNLDILQKDRIDITKDIEMLNKQKNSNTNKISKINYDVVLEEFNKEKEKKIKIKSIELEKMRKNIINDGIFDMEKYKIKSINLEYSQLEKKLKELKEEIVNNNNKLEEIEIILNEKEIKVNMKTYNDYIEKSKELEFLNNKLEIIMNKKEEIEKSLEKLELYEYNPKCKFCMKNSNIEHKIELEKELDMINSNIEKFNSDINKIKKFTNKNNNILNTYELNQEQIINKRENLNIKNNLETDNNVLELKIEAINKELEEKQKLIEKIELYKKNDEVLENIKTLEKEIEMIRNEYSEICGLYLKLNKELFSINDSINKNNIKLEEINKQISDQDYIINIDKLNDNISKLDNFKTNLIKLDELVNKLKVDNMTFEVFYKEYEKIQIDKNEYEIISNFISGEEFTIKIMRQSILPNISDNINKMLEKYSTYQIEMVLNKDTNDSVFIYKTNGSNLSLNGGYETHLINLIFRMVFAKISGVIRTNFIIIDEAFDASDFKNKENIKSMIDYMDNIYDWIIIISHDSYIKSNFENHINIKTINKGELSKQLINI
jgi:DNA repair exonuclease SbcCD ATPase subunit